jgi:hypothetical protein
LEEGDECEFEVIEVPVEFGFVDNHGVHDWYSNLEGLNEQELMDLEYADVVSKDLMKVAKIKI